MCFTTCYTVYAGFSLMDFLRGFIQMVADSLITYAVGWLCAGLTAGLSGLFGKLMGKGAFGKLAAEAFSGSRSLGGKVGDTAIRSAAGLMNDGAGYFASNGRLFVNAWRFIPSALATAWRQAPADQVIGLVGTTVGTAIGTPIGWAPKNAPLSGWNPDQPSPVGRLGTAINNLFRPPAGSQ